jgi:hypothetical protein
MHVSNQRWTPGATTHHPHLIHPVTGRQLTPLGHRRDGRPIWPILGASEDNPAPPTAEPAAPAVTDSGAGTGAPNTAGGPPDAPRPEPAPVSKALRFEGEYDPAKAAALIEKLRTESAAEKKARKDAEAAAKAANDKADAQLAGIAKALGLAGDEKKPPTIEDLTATFQSELGAQRAAHHQLRLELAIRDAAALHNADLAAVTDSRTVIDAVRVLDPTATDYAAQVGEAVKAALALNPRLLATPPAEPDPTPGVSGGEITAGTQPGFITEEQLARMSPAEIDKALDDGRLAHLL